LKVDQISQIHPILKNKVREQTIIVDPILIGTVANIPLVPTLGLPYPESVDPPSIEDLRLLFDPRGAQDWHEDMNIPTSRAKFL